MLLCSKKVMHPFYIIQWFKKKVLCLFLLHLAKDRRPFFQVWILAFIFGIGSTRNKYLINSLRLSRNRFRLSRLRWGIDRRTFLREPLPKLNTKLHTLKNGRSVFSQVRQKNRVIWTSKSTKQCDRQDRKSLLQQAHPDSSFQTM